jgi:hypothetical protein
MNANRDLNAADWISATRTWLNAAAKTGDDELALVYLEAAIGTLHKAIEAASLEGRRTPTI